MVSYAPDIDVNRMRDDFEAIWLLNITTVVLVRDTNPQGGDYFNDDISTTPIERDIDLNIQGVSTGQYSREQQGIITAGQRWHCYALWNEDISSTDIIYWSGDKFRIENLNTGYKEQFVFQEFDIVKINKDDR